VRSRLSVIYAATTPPAVIVKFDDILKAGEEAVVHVGSGSRDVTQPRSLELAKGIAATNNTGKPGIGIERRPFVQRDGNAG
jgi:accessory colonization factor AcfC